MIQELEQLRETYEFPGATVAYILPDGRAESLAIGYADIEDNIPMTPASRMLAASIGKSFVAATVLALALEGRLSLDDSLSKWLKIHPAITLRHLLTHSSGLQDHVPMQSFLDAYAKKWQEPGNPFPPESLVEFIRDKEMLFEPGKGWMYTDTGYILLGLVIEKTTGKSPFQEIQERFLNPLHLTMTEPSDHPKLPGLAAGYTAPNNPFGLPAKTTIALNTLAWNPAMEWTGGGLISNSSDLALWVKLLYEGHALKGEYLSELLTSVPVGDGVRYGLGVAIYENDLAGLAYGHKGVIPGYSSSMRYFPDKRVSIAFQINTDIGMFDHTSNVVADMENRLARIIMAQ